MNRAELIKACCRGDAGGCSLGALVMVGLSFVAVGAGVAWSWRGSKRIKTRLATPNIAYLLVFFDHMENKGLILEKKKTNSKSAGTFIY